MTTSPRLAALLVVVAAASLVPEASRAQTPVKACSAVVVPVAATRRVATPIAKLLEAQLRGRLVQRGCELAPDKAVTAMRTMLRVPRRPQSQDWVRLGKAMVADLVVATTLVDDGSEVRVEVVVCRPASGETLNRASTVAPDALLVTASRLFEELVPPPPPPAASRPASAPASQPAMPPPPPVQPRRPPPPPVPAAPPPPVVQPPSPPPPLAVKRASRPSGQHLMLAAGVRLVTFFGLERIGPALDLELGGIAEYFHWGVCFRPSFGDVNGYTVGARIEGGPHLGPIRLTFGVGMGLTMIPDTADDVDLVTFSFQLVGLVYQWKHLVLAAEVFTLDLNLIPADLTINRDVELVWGFSSGLSVGVRF
jgi:hypothetical protein